MLPFVGANECAGKVVKRIYQEAYRNRVFIVFEDNTYTMYRISGDHISGDGYEDDPCVRNDELKTSDYGMHDALTAGVVTTVEVEEATEKIRVKQLQTREKYEREEFNRLKKKFGG